MGDDQTARELRELRTELRQQAADAARERWREGITRDYLDRRRRAADAQAQAQAQAQTQGEAVAPATAGEAQGGSGYTTAPTSSLTPQEPTDDDLVERAASMLGRSGAALVRFLAGQEGRKATLDEIGAALDGQRVRSARMRSRIRQRYVRTNRALQKHKAPVRLAITSGVIELLINRNPDRDGRV